MGGGVWRDWIEVLSGNAGTPITSGSLPVPLLVRLPIGALIIVWGALHQPPLDRPGRLPAGPAGDLVRQPRDPRRRHPARGRRVDPGALGVDDARRARDWWSLRRPPGGVPQQPQEA